MSVMQMARDHALKSIVAIVVGGALTGLGAWVRAKVDSIVTKPDLEGFAAMIGEEMDARIEPIIEQQAINTEQICTGRRAVLKAAIRDLKVEIAEMRREQDSPGWTEVQTRLLSEWESDYEDAQEELADLNCNK